MTSWVGITATRNKELRGWNICNYSTSEDWSYYGLWDTYSRELRPKILRRRKLQWNWLRERSKEIFLSCDLGCTRPMFGWLEWLDCWKALSKSPHANVFFHLRSDVTVVIPVPPIINHQQWFVQNRSVKLTRKVPICNQTNTIVQIWQDMNCDIESAQPYLNGKCKPTKKSNDQVDES